MDPEESALYLQTVKKNSIVELGTFAKYAGSIDADGNATLRVLLDSIDTKVDLRNVRMRFLMFETFKFPEAMISLSIDPADVADLPEARRKVLTVPFQMTLHGVTVDREMPVVVTLLNDDRVSVASHQPIALLTKEFDLDDGVRKLEEAADVTILPAGSVTFDLVFDRSGSVGDFSVAMAQLEEEAGLPSAMEEQGEFSADACRNRFATMSRAESINFLPGSAQLEQGSTPFLDSLYDVVSRCPGLTVEIAGHTDSDGSEARNQTLSESRAQAVLTYLVNKGIDQEQLRTVGYGESQPAFPNDSDENKRRNRRIEFAVATG